MSFIEKIKRLGTAVDSDERLITVRNQASWQTARTLFLGYIVYSLVMAVLRKPVPDSINFFFFTGLVVYAYYNFKHEGFQFMLPFMNETEETLNQSAVIRSVPWLMIIAGLVTFMHFFTSIPLILRDFAHVTNNSDFATQLFFNIYSLTAGLSSILFAFRIKRGDPLFVYLIIISGIFSALNFILTAPLFLFAILTLNHAHDTFFSFFGIFYALTNLWNFYVVTRYRQQIIDDGNSYTHAPNYSKKQDTMNRWLTIGLAIAMPLIIFISFGIYMFVNHIGVFI